jgi:hypothetical protein
LIFRFDASAATELFSHLPRTFYRHGFPQASAPGAPQR